MDIYKSAVQDTAFKAFREGNDLAGAGQDQRLQLGYEVEQKSNGWIEVVVKTVGGSHRRYRIIVQEAKCND